jgi:hypothetical protein
LDPALVVPLPAPLEVPPEAVVVPLLDGVDGFEVDGFVDPESGVDELGVDCWGAGCDAAGAGSAEGAGSDEGCGAGSSDPPPPVSGSGSSAGVSVPVSEQSRTMPKSASSPALIEPSMSQRSMIVLGTPPSASERASSQLCALALIEGRRVAVAATAMAIHARFAVRVVDRMPIPRFRAGPLPRRTGPGSILPIRRRDTPAPPTLGR